jgi:type I restriction enzyme S subunit
MIKKDYRITMIKNVNKMDLNNQHNKKSRNQENLEKSRFRSIGNYIQEVTLRNTDLQDFPLMGLSISKEFIPSVANIIGTDLSNYKVIKNKQFACSLMQVSRDGKMPVAMYCDEAAIMSPAYPMFEVKNENELSPEYLMMWFSRTEFDREAAYYAVGGVRGNLPWDDFLEMQIPIPPISRQRELVAEYNVVQNRINLNNQLIQTLEETAQAIYKKWFVEEVDRENLPEGWKMTILSKIISVKDGTHDSPEPTKQGFPLVTSTHLNNYDLNLNQTYNISKEDYDQANKRSKVHKHDILFSMIGTIGIVNYVLYDEINFAIKNVGLIKTSERKEVAEYVLFYLKSEYAKNHIASNLNGSTQSYVTLSFLREMPILLPTQKVILEFEIKVKKIVDLIYLKSQETQKLQALQSLLLAKMASIENNRVFTGRNTNG